MGSRAISIDPQAGSRFKSVRDYLGLSQDEMGKECEISQGLVSAIELGNRDIPLLAMQNLYRKHKISPLYIVDGDGLMVLGKKPKKEFEHLKSEMEQMKADLKELSAKA